MHRRIRFERSFCWTTSLVYGLRQVTRGHYDAIFIRKNVITGRDIDPGKTKIDISFSKALLAALARAGVKRSHTDVRGIDIEAIPNAAVYDHAGPAVLGCKLGNVSSQKRAASRCTAINDQHLPITSLLQRRSDKRVVLEDPHCDHLSAKTSPGTVNPEYGLGHLYIGSVLVTKVGCHYRHLLFPAIAALCRTARRQVEV
jgi:hypothetical protein